MNKQPKPKTFRASDFERALIAAYVGQRDAANAALEAIVTEAKKRLGVPTGMVLNYDVASGTFTEAVAPSNTTG